MGVVLAWVVGYVVGAKAGATDFDDVVQALQELRQSEEVRDLWKVLRGHLAHTFRATAELLEKEEVVTSDLANDLADRVRLLMVKR